jgi:hypothetical protein
MKLKRRACELACTLTRALDIAVVVLALPSAVIAVARWILTELTDAAYNKWARQH